MKKTLMIKMFIAFIFSFGVFQVTALADEGANWIVAPQFWSMQDFSEGLAAFQPETGDNRFQWGFIDTSGNIVIEPQFHGVRDFSEGLAAFQSGIGNFQWGFIDTMGNIVIEPQFDNVESFSEGLAAVSIDRLWGFIDRNGEWVYTPMFGHAWAFSDGLARVRVAEYYNGRLITGDGFVNKYGYWVVGPHEFDLVHSFSYGLAWVRVDGRYGFIDTAGEIVIEPQFESAIEFRNGFAAVEVNNNWGLIDTLGNMVIEPQFRWQSWWFFFSEGLALVEVNRLYGFIDKSGGFVIEPQFDFAIGFSEGLAAVQVDDRWGFIDKTGEIVIEPQFSYARPFYDGVAQVNVGHLWGLIPADFVNEARLEFQEILEAHWDAPELPRFRSSMESVWATPEALRVIALWMIAPIAFGLITVFSRRFFNVGQWLVGVVISIAAVTIIVVYSSFSQASAQFNYNMVGGLGYFVGFFIMMPMYIGFIILGILGVSFFFRSLPNAKIKSAIGYTGTMIILIATLVLSAMTLDLPTNRVMREEVERRANEAVMFYEMNEAFFDVLLDVQQRLISQSEDSDVILQSEYDDEDGDTPSEIRIWAGENPYRLTSEHDGIISIVDAYVILASMRSRGYITPGSRQQLIVSISTDNISFEFWRERTVSVSFFTAVSPAEAWSDPWRERERRQFYYDYFVELNENWRVSASHLLRPR